MKLPILFLFVIVTLHSSGQDTASLIKSKWLDLKAQIHHRSTVVDALTSTVSKSKVDKKKTDHAKKASAELCGYIESLSTMDSISISLAEMKNIKLIRAIQDILMEIENLPSQKHKPKFAVLQGQLADSESMIAQSINSYNEVCYRYKRTDLIFHRPDHREGQ